jgi:hypothetical protein
LYGVHGLRFELWRRAQWAHDPNSSDAFHIATGKACSRPRCAFLQRSVDRPMLE